MPSKIEWTEADLFHESINIRGDEIRSKHGTRLPDAPRYQKGARIAMPSAWQIDCAGDSVILLMTRFGPERSTQTK